MAKKQTEVVQELSGWLADCDARIVGVKADENGLTFFVGDDRMTLSSPIRVSFQTKTRETELVVSINGNELGILRI